MKDGALSAPAARAGTEAPQAPAAAAGRRLPPLARRCLAAVGAGGAVSLALVAYLALQVPLSILGLAGAAAVLVLGTWLQVHSFKLSWNGQRLAIHPDEALLLVAFLVLPAPIVVLASTGASVAGQFALRKPLVKLVFNVASQTLSTCAGGVAFVIAGAAGLAPIIAVLFVPLVVSASNQLLVAMLLSTISGSRRAWNGRALLASVSISTAVGVILGLTTTALYRLHPVLLALLVPVAWLAGRMMEAGYGHENEVTMRRAMADATKRMLEDPREDVVIRATLDACREAFSPEAAGIALHDGHAPREWRIGAPPPPGSRTIVCAIPAPHPLRAELWAAIRHDKESDYERDRALLQSAAATLSLGLANARALARLEMSERRLRDAFDAAPDPILVLDAHLTILHANTSARSAFEQARALVGRSVRDVFALPEGIQHGLPDGVLELTPAADGTVARVWEAQFGRLRLDDHAEGLVLMTRDVTERRRLEREALLQQEALSRTERLSALGTLVAGVAHEVNNPLTYMMAGLDLVLLDVDDVVAELADSGLALERVDLQESRRRLLTVQAGAERIEQITKALKVVSRKADTKEEVTVDLVGLIRELELLVGPLVSSKVQLKVEATGSPRVRGVPSELQRAFLNLAKNALEALGDGPGSLTLRAGTRGDRCVVEVVDDGPGMPPEVRARVFTPFFTTKHDGTGLGLPTVFGIVSAHGGEIELQSEPGLGTRFTVLLPPILQGPGMCSDTPSAQDPSRRTASAHRALHGRHDVQ